jgi:hypothetical protein
MDDVDLEEAVQKDWVLMECVPSCGTWRKAHGRCECAIRHDWQRTLNALSPDDRRWVRANLRLAQVERS